MYRWLLSQPLWFPPQRQTTNDLEGAPFFAPFAKGGLLRSNGNQLPFFSLDFLRPEDPVVAPRMSEQIAAGRCRIECDVSDLRGT